MDKVLALIIVVAILAVTFVAFVQGKLAKQAHMREALITEQELYLADVWAEKEDYKQQLGIFIKPKGENK